MLKAGTYAACFLLVGAATWLVLRVLSLLGLVLFPVVVALFLTRILSVPSGWLRRRGWRPGLAAATVMLGFLAVVSLFVVLIAPPVASEFSGLGDSVDHGVTQVEDWLVEDSGFDVTRADVREFRADVAAKARSALRRSDDKVAAGARTIGSGIAGFVLALILTFFALKDGPDLVDRSTRWIPAHRRDVGVDLARGSWLALGGYLRGAALLGLVEAVIIGATMALVGAHLVIPVMLLTFVAAFLPLVVAISAGVVAVLVTLASAGVVPALIVGGVALLVQQLDNDILAPWIYGKTLELHPVVILLSITTGTALFGLAGTVLAVPLTAMAVNAVATIRAHDDAPRGAR